MENVSNLLSPRFISGFHEWIELLKAEGYQTYWQEMKASEYGGHTIRKRVFAISAFTDKPFVFPDKQASTTTVADWLLTPDPHCFVDNYSYINTNKDYYNAIKIADYNKGGQGNRIYSINGQGITLTSSGGGKGGSSGLYSRQEGLYKLSGIEMCLLMGWTLANAQVINSVLSYHDIGFVMGNSIDLNLMSLLAKSIIEQYFPIDKK